MKPDTIDRAGEREGEFAEQRAGERRETKPIGA